MFYVRLVFNNTVFVYWSVKFQMTKKLRKQLKKTCKHENLVFDKTVRYTLPDAKTGETKIFMFAFCKDCQNKVVIKSRKDVKKDEPVEQQG